MHGVIGRKTTKYTVMYGCTVYIHCSGQPYVWECSTLNILPTPLHAPLAAACSYTGPRTPREDQQQLPCTQHCTALCVGLTRTVCMHRIWPYIWWFPCQNYRVYTVYIWFWLTLPVCKFVRSRGRAAAVSSSVFCKGEKWYAFCASALVVCVCLCVCLCVCVCVCLCVCVCVCVCMCVCVWLCFICVCVVCLCVCLFVCMCLCVCERMFVVCIYMCVCHVYHQRQDLA